MKTGFKMHFGYDGKNTVIHESAADVWRATGMLIDIHLDEKPLVQKHCANDLAYIDGKIQLKPGIDAGTISTAPKKTIWLERALLVAGGAAATAGATALLFF